MSTKFSLYISTAVKLKKEYVLCHFGPILSKMIVWSMHLFAKHLFLSWTAWIDFYVKGEFWLRAAEVQLLL